MRTLWWNTTRIGPIAIATGLVIGLIVAHDGGPFWPVFFGGIAASLLTAASEYEYKAWKRRKVRRSVRREGE